jgi:hypothetical protein
LKQWFISDCRARKSFSIEVNMTSLGSLGKKEWGKNLCSAYRTENITLELP